MAGQLCLKAESRWLRPKAAAAAVGRDETTGFVQPLSGAAGLAVVAVETDSVKVGQSW